MAKRIVSLLLVITIVVSALPTSVFADEENQDFIYENSEDCTENSSPTKVYEGKDDYQILNITVDDNNTAEIYYNAAENCSLSLEVFDNVSGDVVDTITKPVSAGISACTSVDIIGNYEYYYLEVVLKEGEVQLSDVYSFYDRTREYEDFLNVTVDDPEFENNVVIDYGLGSNGLENFLVVNEDVKIVYVDSMDDIEIENDYVDEDEIALFSVDDEKTTYTFTDIEDDSTLRNIEEGDKVLILPEDDKLKVRTLVVGETDVVSLFDGTEVISLTSSDDEKDDDFFDYARINLEEERSNPDIDFSEMDEELELLEVNDDYATIEWSDDIEILDEDEAELMGSASKSYTTTVQQEFCKFTLKDKLTTKVGIGYSLEWSRVLPKSASVSATVDATNNLTLKSSGISANLLKKKWQVGTVVIYGVSIPINLHVAVSVGAKLDASATQTASATIGATWSSSGGVVSNKSFSGSSSYDFEVEGKLTLKVGVGTGGSFSLLKSKLKAEVQAGVQVEGKVTPISTSDTQTHECDFCLLGDLGCYYEGELYVKIPIKGVIINYDNSDLSDSKSLFKFHVSKRNGKWTAGKGTCDYYSYKITFKTTNSKGTSPLSSVDIYKGSTKLGTTNSKGTFSKKILKGTYTIKAKKSKYTTQTKTYTVKSAGTVTFKMAKTGSANETYYTVDDLVNLTDAEYNDFIADTEAVSNTIFKINDGNDLKKLSDFVNKGNKDTTGLRFVLNNSTGYIDLSGIDFSPIGTVNNMFKGELDGNNLVIKGLNINGTSSGIGLFGNLSNANIYNLGIENVNIKGSDNVGGIAGYAENETKIENCYVTGNILGTTNVGGLVGMMDTSEITNSYNTADISGNTNVGGIVGSMNQTIDIGKISNCYSMGKIIASGVNGGIVGKMTYSNVKTDSESEDDSTSVGIQYCYYLDSSSDAAVGSTDSMNTVIAYAVNEKQAKGEGNDAYITDDTNSFAFAYTLLDALNAWCVAFGNESGEDLTENDDDNSESGIIVGNSYREWFKDVGLSNGGYPLFAEKSPVYKLTVNYVYADGSEAKPSVVLYLEEGQSYDVDSYKIEGYNTGDVEYSGVMPAYDMEFRVIYVKDDIFNSSVSGLLSSGSEAVSGDSYSISNSADLVALSSYVNSGKNTIGVTFKQTDNIDMTNVSFIPIGTKKNPFEGIYEGNYGVISNLVCSKDEDYVGLFGYVKNGKLNNFSVTTNINGNNYVGGVVGYIDNTVIENCSVSKTSTVTGNDYIGGVIGYATDSSVILNSSEGNVTGKNYIGGILGATENSTVKNTYNASIVAGNNYVGGICGNSVSGNIVNSYNLGNVGNSNSVNVGGIAGDVGTARVENCYNVGTISGSGNFGALTSKGTVKVTNNYYLEGVSSVGSGSEGTNTQFSNSTIQTMVDGLNSWVDTSDIDGLYRWYVGNDSVYPIFGAIDSHWLTDCSIASNKLTFTYSNENYDNSILYVALYSADNKFISIKSYNESGSYETNLDGVGYVRLYIWNKDTQEPMDNSVTLDV